MRTKPKPPIKPSLRCALAIYGDCVENVHTKMSLARLIADYTACDDLLAACKRCELKIFKMIEDGEMIIPAQDAPIEAVWSAIDDVRNAVAKAERGGE